jgi:hypothetical protein
METFVWDDPSYEQQTEYRVISAHSRRWSYAHSIVDNGVSLELESARRICSPEKIAHKDRTRCAPLRKRSAQESFDPFEPTLRVVDHVGQPRVFEVINNRDVSQSSRSYRRQ